jgi:hypothetical protein
VLEELQTDPQLGKEARIQLRRLDRARSQRRPRRKSTNE